VTPHAGTGSPQHGAGKRIDELARIRRRLYGGEPDEALDRGDANGHLGTFGSSITALAA
jgi:hypothetical protein